MGNGPGRRRQSDPQSLQATLGPASTGLDAEAANDSRERLNPQAQARSSSGRWAFMSYGRRGLQRGSAYAQEDPRQGLPVAPARSPEQRRFTPPTPSTATPPSRSPGVNALSSPDEWEAGSEESWTPRENEHQKLSQARQRAKDSAEALRMQLSGFGDAMSLRYAVWPAGARVRVTLEADEDSQDAPAETRFLQAKIVSYNSSEKTFEVKLRDGSTRVVPQKRVERIRRASKTSRRPAPGSDAAGSTRGGLSGWPEDGGGSAAASADLRFLT